MKVEKKTKVRPSGFKKKVAPPRKGKEDQKVTLAWDDQIEGE